MEDWAEIRRLHRSEGLSKTAITRPLGISRNTVAAALNSDRPPKYQRQPAGSLVGGVEAQIPTSTFVSKAENVVLLGPPGIGKTHLAIGLGIKAAQNGHSVLFDTASAWIGRLQAAHQAGQLDTELKKIKRHKLIIIDEVGYIAFDTDAANLFFQLVAARYEQGSIIITSNLPFGRWGETFCDVVAAAMIDRLVHHAEVLALSGESYRTRARRELLAKDHDN